MKDINDLIIRINTETSVCYIIEKGIIGSTEKDNISR